MGRTGTCAVSPVVKRTATGLGNENEKRGLGERTLNRSYSIKDLSYVCSHPVGCEVLTYLCSIVLNHLSTGVETSSGALAVNTGEFTGRSPMDRFIVRDVITEEKVWWGDVNIPFKSSDFDKPYSRVIKYLNGKDLYVRLLCLRSA